MARILVVDDHPHIRRLIERELAADGHEVITAASGEEALHLVREAPPVFVILDVMLPGIDGFAVLERLKFDPGTRSVRVIMLTAKDHLDEISHGLQLGADWYLTKPFGAGDLASLVRRFLSELPVEETASPIQCLLLPIAEIDRLTMTAADAFEQALAGQVSDGFRCLAAAQERAQAAQAAGRPWASELAQRYQELLDHYAARFGGAEPCLTSAAPGARREK